jgi:alanine dehydrogenase
MALNNAPLPFVLELADHGVWTALASDRHLRNGLNVCHGQVTHAAVARDLGYMFAAPERLIESAAPSQEVA